MAVHALIHKLYNEPWAITQDSLHSHLRTLEQLLQGALVYSEQAPQEPLPDLERVGNVAIIPICGTLLKAPEPEEIRYLGACDVDHVRLLAEIAAADPTIEKSVLHVRSPGGQILGIQECAGVLADLAKQKPLYAFTDTVMGSAAYWLGSQATAGIFCTPSSRLGSIGGYAVYQDASEFWNKMGVKFNAVSTGKWKLTGAPFKAMSEEERAYLQAFCDKSVAGFKAAVLSARSIAPEHMEGQVFDAEDSCKFGLADGIFNSLEEMIDTLSR